MASINKVILVGNLGRDPEVRVFQDGGKIATVSIATTEYWTDRQSGEKRELTEWHKVTFSDKLADIVDRFLRKGSCIYVEGKLRTRSWDDKQTGQKRYSTEIRAESMQMLGGKPDGQRSSGGYNQQGSAQYGGRSGYGNYDDRPNEYARQSSGSGFGNRNGGYQKPPVEPVQRPAPAHVAEPVHAPAPASMGAFDEFKDEDIPF
ncbi:MAG: single-stranded DNA-binding protein [Actinomycetaceae bacterium]|nr:single-stranded DNA-binding protein [Actinomycetaceae bacterium]